MALIPQLRGNPFLPVAAPTELASSTQNPIRIRILPKEGLFWLLGTAALFLTGMVKGINLIILLAYLMLGVWLVNFMGAKWSLRGIRAKRGEWRPIYAEISQEITIDVHGTGTHGWSMIDAGPKHYLSWLAIGNLTEELTRLRGTIRLPQRGRYQLYPLIAQSRFPFGLIHRQIELAPGEEILVFPKPTRIRRERLQVWLLKTVHGANSYRERIRRSSIDEAEIYGLRDYQAGDNPRSIHWKTTARRGKLMVCEYEDGTSPNLMLIIDPWLPSRPSAAEKKTLEATLSLAAGICQEWCRDAGSRLSVVIAGEKPQACEGTGSSDHLYRIMELLALEKGAPVYNSKWVDQIPMRARHSPTLVISTRTSQEIAHQVSEHLGRIVSRIHANDPLPWRDE